MTEGDVLRVRVETGEGARRRVLAPAVGLWSAHPGPGALLGPGAAVGAIAQGNQRRGLVLPDGVTGRVASALPRDRVVPVEYGQVLFELVPLAAAGSDEAEESGHAPRAEGEPLAPGLRAVVAPTDGVWYRGPSPEAPPFVAPGQRLRRGQPIGLVEVMKTFNQILYGGADLPDEAEVVEVRAGDGEEVRAGRVLLVVRGR